MILRSAIFLGLVLTLNQAHAQAVTFIVGPRAGVTTNRLSQAQVEELARNTVDSYSLKISRADATFRRTLENAGIDPSIDTSGEILNELAHKAVLVREKAYRDAIPEAARETISSCRRLCYVQVDGRTFQ